MMIANPNDHPNIVELKKYDRELAESVLPLLPNINSGPALLKLVSTRYKDEVLQDSSPGTSAWSQLALFLLNSGQAHQALALFWSLYEHMLEKQTITRAHKGTPLLWISECYRHLNFPIHAKRYLMLAHCEDALTYGGTIPPEKVGAYFRLAWWHGVPIAKLDEYATQFHALVADNAELALFPEALLQDVDDGWIAELPSPNEAYSYRVNRAYVNQLIAKLGTEHGKILERLAAYLMSCMPGCRTRIRRRTRSTDYDVVCAMDGMDVDFRSELGRHFVCECKDWKDPADYTTMAKFCRVLDSTKSRFGILFSKTGISGNSDLRDANLERLKIFQDRGIVIVVLDLSDLTAVSAGANLIALLRDKYERVRLDITNDD